MLGNNNPMEIENWSDKMEFQGRGAAHIHGVAWCNLQKVAELIDIDTVVSEYEEEMELSEDEVHEKSEDTINDSVSVSKLENAFHKLRMGGKLTQEEEKALIAFSDKFVTCTLNPDMAAKMIDENLTADDGKEIVNIAKETQTHHHTKTLDGPQLIFFGKLVNHHK